MGPQHLSWVPNFFIYCEPKEEGSFGNAPWEPHELVPSDFVPLLLEMVSSGGSGVNI